MDLEIAASAFPHLPSHCRLFACPGTRIRSSQAAEPGTEQRWALFHMWAEACWQGQVDRVIEQLSTLRDGLGPLSEEEAESLADNEPRKILAEELGYLQHNRDRMDYPRYRQQGLPWTSSHVESTVKLFNSASRARRSSGVDRGRGHSATPAASSRRMTAWPGISRPGPAARSAPTKRGKIGRRRRRSENEPRLTPRSAACLSGLSAQLPDQPPGVQQKHAASIVADVQSTELRLRRRGIRLRIGVTCEVSDDETAFFCLISPVSEGCPRS